jgi:lipid-binding SYLF domain-containing protein
MSKLSWKKSVAVAIVGGVVGVMSLQPVRADDASKDTITEAKETIDTFKKSDPSMSRFFETSVGYVVFPSVTKGAFGVGGAGGKGILFEGGSPVGKAHLRQLTIGAQMGGQSYAEIIFFETPAALADFKRNKASFAAQVSAVAAKNGASADANYRNGVAVFTATNTGLMYEAAIGGQKFKYQPFKNKQD